MRVALVSDMHGNAVAFRAVLADLEQFEPDLIVSLGDVAQGGPQPRECVDLLRELGCPCAYGNSDHFLVALDFGQEEVTEQQLATAHWSRAQLGDDGLEFLRGFEPTIEAGPPLLCCHATPRSIEEVILPATPYEEVEPVLADVAAPAVATGHVHLQWLRRFGPTLWLSVGSVGLVWEHREPLDEVPFHPVGEYAVLDLDSLAVEFRRVAFDVEELIADARSKDFPDFDDWAAKWKR